MPLIRPESRGTGAKPATPASLAAVLKLVRVADCGCQQLSTQQRQKPGHTRDNAGKSVLLELRFDQRAATRWLNVTVMKYAGPAPQTGLGSRDAQEVAGEPIYVARLRRAHR